MLSAAICAGAARVECGVRVSGLCAWQKPRSCTPSRRTCIACATVAWHAATAVASPAATSARMRRPVYHMAVLNACTAAVCMPAYTNPRECTRYLAENCATCSVNVTMPSMASSGAPPTRAPTPVSMPVTSRSRVPVSRAAVVRASACGDVTEHVVSERRPGTARHGHAPTLRSRQAWTRGPSLPYAGRCAVASACTCGTPG